LYSTNNLASAIFAQDLKEMSYLVEQMGGQLHSVYTLAGADDFYITCQSGRNKNQAFKISLCLPFS
jgi:glycerol-3-phosphate dehydrogenase